MSDFDIAGRRLRNQLLIGSPAVSPEAVIRHFVAVQGQEYPHAKWGVAQRTQGATNADLDAMLASGALIRTHPMRPTWHVVLPEDIRWLLAITGPRVHVASGSIYRKEGLDEATLRRGDEVMARALEGGTFLTRAELKEALEAAGINASGLRLGYLVMLPSWRRSSAAGRCGASNSPTPCSMSGCRRSRRKTVMKPWPSWRCATSGRTARPRSMISPGGPA